MSRRVLPLALLCFASSGPTWSLTPQEILVVANSRSPESVEIARQYCAKRHVPVEQMAALAMPTTTTVSRTDYDSAVAVPVREFLEDRPELRARIRCLLTVYGVPLSIGRYRPSPEEQGIIEALTSRLDTEQRALHTEVASLCAIARQVKARIPGALASLGSEPPRGGKLPAEIRATNALLATISRKAEAPGSYRLKESTAGRLAEARDCLLGRSKGGTARDAEAKAGPADELSDFAKAEIGSEARDKLYTARRETHGLLGLCAQLLTDKGVVEKRESEASVDSELSLLFQKGYPLYRWQPNLHNPVYRSKLKPPVPPPPLMVARLDGPSSEIAGALVDRAIKGESLGLKGVFYIDASALKRDQGKTYAAYDVSLEKLAASVKKHTTVQVVLDTSGDLFPPAGCPNAALYCGWYNLGTYIDSFDWAPGAVGYHISSFAAQGLRKPESKGWCKRMLEEGVAATIGPVSEPYLHAFPLPESFFRVLLSGRMTLVECFFLTKPFTSWRMVLIGDPLYNPFRYHPVTKEAGAADAALGRAPG